ncbi:MAG TPA: Ig-like domain-containing protein [Gemmatimonadaceae bacterium]
MRRFACLTSAALVACTTATDPVPVATIMLQPQFDSIEVGDVYDSWVVTLKDAAGLTLTGRPLAWESSNPTAAPVDPATGDVTGVGGGATTLITVRAEGKSAQASIKVLHPILAIVVSPDSFDLPMTTTRTIVPQLVGPGGLAITNRVITWSSSNPSIAVVGATGVVTPVSPGTTTITIRAGTKEKLVRVRVVGEPVSSVRITPQGTVHVIRLGQSRQFTAECLNATQQVLPGRTITWNSANPVVASVNGSGLVSGNSLGSAQITASCDNSASASFSAQVTPVPVSSVTITPNALTISVGTQSQLTATARDSAGNALSLQGRQVQWSSSNIPVAQVSTQGVVSGGSVGSANITVTVDGIASAPVPVNVTSFFSLGSRSSPRAAERSASVTDSRHARLDAR